MIAPSPSLPSPGGWSYYHRRDAEVVQETLEEVLHVQRVRRSVQPGQLAAALRRDAQPGERPAGPRGPGKRQPSGDGSLWPSKQESERTLFSNWFGLTPVTWYPSGASQKATITATSAQGDLKVELVPAAKAKDSPKLADSGSN
jgi:hypothetical protein